VIDDVDARVECCRQPVIRKGLADASMAEQPLSTQYDQTIGRERQACLGVYGTTVTPGRVAVGDPVSIEV